MKKQDLKEEKKELPKKIIWNRLLEMRIDEVQEIIEVHGRVLIFTKYGDFYELKEMEF